MTQGTVSAIYIGIEKAGPLTSVETVRAVSGHGIQGDRYFKEAPAPDTEITLIEAEAIEAAARDQKLRLQEWECRRNVVTRNVALNHLVGREFRIGGVALKGLRLCEPCGHLEKMTQPGVIGALAHRGGLRAQILIDGDIHVGDAVDVT